MSWQPSRVSGGWCAYAIAACSVLSCGEDASEEETKKVVQVQVLDATGAPVPGAFVAAYTDDYGPYVFTSRASGEADEIGIVSLEFESTDAGVFYFEAGALGGAVPLSSLADGAVAKPVDIDITPFLQMEVREFVSGEPNIPGQWGHYALDQTFEVATFDEALRYEFRWDDGSAEVGQCTFKASGHWQGYLTCGSDDGFVPREFFVVGLTARYMTLDFGSTSVFERTDLPGGVTPPPSETAVPSSPEPTPNPETNPGDNGLGLPDPEPSCLGVGGFGESCASNTQCPCDANTCLPLFGYCSVVGCGSDDECPLGWSCQSLGNATACLKSE